MLCFISSYGFWKVNFLQKIARVVRRRSQGTSNHGRENSKRKSHGPENFSDQAIRLLKNILSQELLTGLRINH